MNGACSDGKDAAREVKRGEAAHARRLQMN
jgi:hypothetical protein